MPVSYRWHDGASGTDISDVLVSVSLALMTGVSAIPWYQWHWCQRWCDVTDTSDTGDSDDTNPVTCLTAWQRGATHPPDAVHLLAGPRRARRQLRLPALCHACPTKPHRHGWADHRPLQVSFRSSLVGLWSAIGQFRVITDQFGVWQSGQVNMELAYQ